MTQSMWSLQRTFPFLDARQEGKGRVHVVGVPFEVTSSFRFGSHEGPDAIRRLAESLETYSPYRRRDVAAVDVVDLGNVMVDEPFALFPTHLDEMRVFCASLRGEQFTLFLGGEHTTTLAFLSPEDVADPGFALVVLDAHLDLRDAYQGTFYSHASWARRALEWLGPGRLFILGARSGTEEEFALAREHGLLGHSLDDLLAWLEERSPHRLHLSLDIDVLDPAHAPGTGNPEPLGWDVHAVMEVIELLKGWPVLSADIVEYSPPHDCGGRTGILAGFLAREMILTWG